MYEKKLRRLLRAGRQDGIEENRTYSDNEDESECEIKCCNFFLDIFCVFVVPLFCASIFLTFKDPETAEQDVRRTNRFQQQSSQVRLDC